MSPTLQICVIGPFCVKSFLSHFLCCAHWSRIKPLSAILQFPWPFVSSIQWYQFITSCLQHFLSWNSVPILDPISLWLTSCWMMKDALIPSFQHISSYRLQHLSLGTRFRVLWQYLGDCSNRWQFPLLLGSGNTLMSHTWWILQVFDFDSLYSHILECTRSLGDHFHSWWFPSCLLMVLIIDW